MAINVGIKVGFQLVSNLVIDGVGRVVGPVCACVCVCVCKRGVTQKSSRPYNQGSPKNNMQPVDKKEAGVAPGQCAYTAGLVFYFSLR